VRYMIQSTGDGEVKWSETLCRPLITSARREIGELSKVKKPGEKSFLCFILMTMSISLFYERYTYDENMVMIDYTSFCSSLLFSSYHHPSPDVSITIYLENYLEGLQNPSI